MKEEQVKQLIKEKAKVFLIQHGLFGDWVKSDKTLDEDFFVKQKHGEPIYLFELRYAGTDEDGEAWYDDWHICPIENVFLDETERDFVYKYGYECRTERLGLISWNQLQEHLKENEFWEMTFTDEKHNKHLISANTSEIYIIDYNIDGCGKDYFRSSDLTEEKYIKACEYCLKLFRGIETAE